MSVVTETKSTDNQTPPVPPKKPRTPRRGFFGVLVGIFLVLLLGALAVLGVLNNNNDLQKSGTQATAVPGYTAGSSATVIDLQQANDLTADPKDPTAIYLATDSGVRRSSDSGKTWQQSSEGLGAVPVLSLSFDGDDQQRPLYAATDGSGLFKSVDGGKTWQNIGLPNRTLVKVVGRNGKVVVGVNGPLNGVYVSDDGGKTWTPPSPSSLPANAKIENLAFDPNNNQNLYMTTAYVENTEAEDWSRVKLSRDGGISWNRLGEWGPTTTTPDPRGSLSLLLAAPGERVYAGDGNTLYRLTPDRKAWVPVSNGLPDKGVFGVQTDPQRRGIVYAATSTGLFRNSDGTRWVKVGEGEQLSLLSEGAGLVKAGTKLQTTPSFITINARNQKNDNSLSSTLLYALNSDGKLSRLENKEFGEGQYANITDGTIVADFSLYGGVNPAAALAAPAAADPSRLYFKETGHYLTGGFKNFWEKNAGQTYYGFPITEEFSEFDLQQNVRRTVQYFERVKLEYLPNALPGQEIKVALLGKEALVGKYVVPARFTTTTTEIRFFTETQHTLKGEFRKYWENNGGLNRFGYPITEEIEEKGADGKTYLVQYYERFKFRLDNGKVLMASLGVEVLQSRGWIAK